MNTDDLTLAKQRLKAAKEEVERLQKKEEALAARSPESQLAIVLHKKLCTANHTDQCGWYYFLNKDGIPTWRGGQERYLQQARKLVAKTNLPINTLIMVINEL